MGERGVSSLRLRGHKKTRSPGDRVKSDQAVAAASGLGGRLCTSGLVITPLRRHRVHAYTRWVNPSTEARPFCRFGM